jgi:asparagine synthase (glutamine-hydrolysing)
MCGLAGFIEFGSDGAREDLVSQVNIMGSKLQHRGPDGMNSWADPSEGLALVHCRLAVVDLSEAGVQPMTSSCGGFVLVYNGEVYNADEIRQELLLERNIRFRGHSDTEVILEGIAAWGISKTISKLVGMFAIAVWDISARRLSLIRDRLGIKPLYWHLDGGLFVFGSELKALCAHKKWTGRLDRNAISKFLEFNYIPAPQSAWKGTNKLGPGKILTLSQENGELKHQIQAYWSLAEVAERGIRNQYGDSDEELIEELDRLLTDAVRCRMIADVPLGAFLSGGIDSTTVVALAQKVSESPVKTFSVGFEEEKFNEADKAAVIAKYLGTDHTELYVTADDAIDVIPKLVDMFDEPFSDSSQIPTYLVSAMTREHVTVALSGDGGDELFAGYDRYLSSMEFDLKVRLVPKSVRCGMSKILDLMNREFFAFLCEKMLPGPIGNKLVGRQELLSALLTGGGDAYFENSLRHWHQPPILTKEDSITASPVSCDLHTELLERMRFHDMSNYLPDDILTKVDRASMSVSLEARVPLLDHRIVEFAWRLNEQHLIRDGVGKWPLRQVLSRYVPAELVDRPKMGFGVPIGEWMKGPLKTWVESLISPASLDAHGVLDTIKVQKIWNEHLRDQRNWQYHLWDVVVLQSWLNRYL